MTRGLFPAHARNRVDMSTGRDASTANPLGTTETRRLASAQPIKGEVT